MREVEHFLPLYSSVRRWKDRRVTFSQPEDRTNESRVAELRRYIQTQQEHHARISFEDELRKLAQKHRIAVDEKYLLG